jgi:hypothetical protein
MSKQKRPQSCAAPLARTPPHADARVNDSARAPLNRRFAPAPPAVYRPQPLQKCLQPKQAAGLQSPRPPAPARAPQYARPQLPPPAPPRAKPAAAPQPRPQPAPARGAALQPHASKGHSRPAAASVVQAVKFYPNLHPGAVERVEPGSVFRLENFTDQYRLRKADSHGVYVPNQQYNFVRTVEGSMLLHNRYRHPSIAEGRQVLYAGEAFFNNGRLEWWSNGSGHYQPDAEDAAQAALPMDQFFSYQQIIKGEHKRKRD